MISYYYLVFFCFQQNEISLSFIESRPSNSNTDCLDVIVKFTADASVREKVVNDFKERGIEAKTFAFNKDSKQGWNTASFWHQLVVSKPGR